MDKRDHLKYVLYMGSTHMVTTRVLALEEGTAAGVITLVSTSTLHIIGLKRINSAQSPYLGPLCMFICGGDLYLIMEVFGSYFIMPRWITRIIKASLPPARIASGRNSENSGTIAGITVGSKSVNTATIRLKTDGFPFIRVKKFILTPP